MDDRTCSRRGCRNYADRTVTVDYRERMLVVGPLQAASRRAALAGAYDLCDVHAAEHAAPAGWSIVRHEPYTAS